MTDKQLKKQPLVQIKQLKQYYNEGTRNEVKAVDGVSFDIYRGETFGLVGESGSGKSTMGRAIVNLYQPTDGDIIFDGKSWTERQTTQSKLAFNKEVKMIFQYPYASLNPRMKEKDIIAEFLQVHKPDRKNKE